MNKIIVALFVLVFGTASSCTESDSDSKGVDNIACDFATLSTSQTDTYTFNPPFSDAFTQSPRWVSENADFQLVYSTGQLVADSDDTSVASEAWKLYNKQMPYGQSWEISVDIDLPLYWNTYDKKDAQIGAGLFVGKPVASGQSAKVYECNVAVVAKEARFAQAQLIANRLGEDPINVQHTVLSQALESANMKIRFCTQDKTLAFFVDDKQVGKAQRIDAKGLDDWKLSNNDLMDVGIMGFAEHTNIPNAYSPKLTKFTYKVY